MKSSVISSLPKGAKALFISKLYEESKRPLLIVTEQGNKEGGVLLDLPLFTKAPLFDFPSWETLPGEDAAPSSDVIGQRYETLQALRKEQNCPIVITTLQGLLQNVLSPENLSKLQIDFFVGQKISEGELKKQLLEMGYEEKSLTGDKGEFSFRKGILDLYPASHPEPFRLEIWDGAIESIRKFDPLGQRSVEKVSSFSLTPAKEGGIFQKKSSRVSLLHYFSVPPVLIIDGIEEVEEKWVQLKEYFDGDSFFKETADLTFYYLEERRLDELSEVKRTREKVYFSAFNRELECFEINHPYQGIRNYLGLDEGASGEELLEQLPSLPSPLSISFIAENQAQEEKIKNHLSHLRGPLPVPWTFERGYLSHGFADQSLIFFPYTEFTRQPKIRRQKQRSAHHGTALLLEHFEPGDLVVHLQSGIGKFLEIKKELNHEGTEVEFLVIEYAEGGKLFVPLAQSHLVSRYIGMDQAEPKLSLIGSPKWRNTREKTEKEILGYAKELLETYANREIKGGYAFPADSEEMVSFEQTFPFVETEDQLSAIHAIKQDMEKAKPMDRLVCGDVGYGKTEVAMRAAFKAVSSGKQVAVLVPTTLLALQHYDNFTDRMGEFPVRIVSLSRFLKPGEKHKTLEKIRAGEVDIVIGTHRLISDDVVFQNLGLVIIDEEQRFGVKAKEHLKKVKTGVDCLTLSATPIPRTLYLSLLGVRDVSQINTPPQDRIPIQSYLVEKSDQIIQTALKRELNREGQAFFIHNRVETIYEVSSHLKKLVPEAKIAVAHGQMASGEIDSVFHRFRSGEADILVATTLVENGIDVANGNTILIDKSDTFGISDLYQLRGRVGRWNRRAFCYFLVNKLDRLPEISRKRLDALLSNSGQGGGMKVALRDLEIRGAGDLLGVAQSGQVASIGFHLYCKLLKKTIQELQGEKPKKLTDCKVEMSIGARLPENYVNSVDLRLDLYRRLGDALSVEEVEEIRAEILDRFGLLPHEAKWLLALTRLRVLGGEANCTLIRVEKHSFLIQKKKKDQTIERRGIIPLPLNPEKLEEKVKGLLIG